MHEKSLLSRIRLNSPELNETTLPYNTPCSTSSLQVDPIIYESYYHRTRLAASPAEENLVHCVANARKNVYSRDAANRERINSVYLRDFLSLTFDLTL